MHIYICVCVQQAGPNKLEIAWYVYYAKQPGSLAILLSETRAHMIILMDAFLKFNKIFNKRLTMTSVQIRMAVTARGSVGTLEDVRIPSSVMT